LVLDQLSISGPLEAPTAGDDDSLRHRGAEGIEVLHLQAV